MRCRGVRRTQAALVSQIFGILNLNKERANTIRTILVTLVTFGFLTLMLNRLCTWGRKKDFVVRVPVGNSAFVFFQKNMLFA